MIIYRGLPSIHFEAMLSPQLLQMKCLNRFSARLAMAERRGLPWRLLWRLSWRRRQNARMAYMNISLNDWAFSVTWKQKIPIKIKSDCFLMLRIQESPTDVAMWMSLGSWKCSLGKKTSVKTSAGNEDTSLNCVSDGGPCQSSLWQIEHTWSSDSNTYWSDDLLGSNLSRIGVPLVAVGIGLRTALGHSSFPSIGFWQLSSDQVMLIKGVQTGK